MLGLLPKTLLRDGHEDPAAAPRSASSAPHPPLLGQVISRPGDLPACGLSQGVAAPGGGLTRCGLLPARRVSNRTCRGVGVRPCSSPVPSLPPHATHRGTSATAAPRRDRSHVETRCDPTREATPPLLVAAGCGLTWVWARPEGANVVSVPLRIRLRSSARRAAPLDRRRGPGRIRLSRQRVA